MKRILILFFILSIYVFPIINDEISFFAKKDIETLSNRLDSIEEKSGIKFFITISEKEQSKENNLNNLEKSVIIEMIRDSAENRLKVRLRFTKDINIASYKEEIESVLDKMNSLVEDQSYLDLLYELTGNVVDIINLVEIENQEMEKFNKSKKARKILLIVLISVLVVFALAILLRIFKKRRKICRHCGIEMENTDTYLNGNKIVKMYSCKICGHTKKFISIRRQG